VLTCEILQSVLLTFSIKNYGGDLFINEVLIITAALFALSASLFTIEKLGYKPLTVICFCLATIAIICLLYVQMPKLISAFPLLDQDAVRLPCIFFAKLGIASIHNMAFLFIIWNFDATKSTMVFSHCNLGGRLGAVIAPELAEIQQPFPMAFMGLLSILCLVACLSLVWYEKI